MQRSAIRISSSMMFCLALAFPCYLRAEGDAAKLYKANCAVCHAADGSGNTSSGKALKAKDLRSDEVQKISYAVFCLKKKKKKKNKTKKLKKKDKFYKSKLYVMK